MKPSRAREEAGAGNLLPNRPSMSPHPELRQFLAQRQTRRAFLGRTSQGVGALALASLLNPTLLSVAAATARNSKWTGVINPLDYPQKAKRVIWLSMAGGPSHLETFDYKPKLAILDETD